MFTEDSVYLGKQEKYQNFENLLIFVTVYIDFVLKGLDINKFVINMSLKRYLE